MFNPVLFESFLTEVLKSNRADKDDLLALAHNRKPVERLSEDAMIFVLKYGQKLYCFCDVLNELILPEGTEKVYEYLPAWTENLFSFWKMAEIISTTQEDWRRDRLIVGLIKFLKYLDEREKEEVYLSFLRWGFDPDTIPEISKLRSEIDPENIEKVKFVHQALGTRSTKIPDHVVYWKMNCEYTEICLSQNVVTMFHDHQHSLHSSQEKFSREEFSRIGGSNSEHYRYENFYDDMANYDFDRLEVVHTNGQRFVYPPEE